MKLLLIFSLLVFLLPCSLVIADDPATPDPKSNSQIEDAILSIYSRLGSASLSFEAFSQAYRGYCRIIRESVIEKSNILTLIDFDKSSCKERFYIIDLKKVAILYESLVAHGRNSGEDMATSFSNIPNSYKSSLGFYLTGETYYGQHGLSLKLDGLEPGINDKARDRHIVIHSAEYVSRNFIEKHGRLGRSFGCPSLPSDNYQKIIDLIKEKSLLFIFSSKPDYFQKSRYL